MLESVSCVHRKVLISKAFCTAVLKEAEVRTGLGIRLWSACDLALPSAPTV